MNADRIGGICRTCGRTSLEHASGKCPGSESAQDVLIDVLKALPVLRNVLRAAGLAGVEVAEQLHSRAQAVVARAQQQAASAVPVAWLRTYSDGQRNLRFAPLGREPDAQDTALYAAPTPTAPADVMADAARYRLLRRGQHWSVINGIGDILRGDELDAAIDARAVEKGTT